MIIFTMLAVSWFMLVLIGLSLESFSVRLLNLCQFALFRLNLGLGVWVIEEERVCSNSSMCIG